MNANSTASLCEFAPRLGEQGEGKILTPTWSSPKMDCLLIPQ